ncbi:DHA2 family efflux MFS transporter permease subunit [Conexibacter stalactiti]|uniref:DHA2 family efflux MFS transporter permease subunit n=1 Tax=Conexibacter stalactiti TaxID=1940611 RepID=A0ABU4HMQ6_9ACTN|nr:DHA2 family efflux MFS transporter permease subunit [Conexibacter stalactiti]MDW5594583.1 DHA2 family efflux MFS transporter permease subunit [Conexibacter stalactiti]MEC5035225.1 DHA2 family efflux MFS transporter permease subunit [Conexibacter stalactiti]
MSAESQPVSATAKRWTLVACIVGSATVFLDGTVVNVALPAIAEGLDSGLSAQTWIVEAYLLTLGSLILLGGSLGDLLGRRRVFSLGVAAFGVCSLLCALAPSTDLLIVARALQGIAGALLVPSTLALIVDTFPESERGAAIGSWTAWTGTATVIGPLGGGLLLEVVSWRWIFAINVVPVLLTLWLLRHAPEGHRERGTPIDWTGAVLCALGLAGPVFALTEQPSHGWGDPRVAIPLLAGAALLAAFVWWEGRVRAPMLPLSMFRIRNFSVGNLATFLLYGGLNVASLFLVLYLQQVAGWSPVAAGAAMLPTTAMMFVLSKRFGALADTYGPRRFMGFGPLIAGAGLLLLLRVGTAPDYLTEVLPAVLLFGLGLAMTVAPLTATVLGAAGVEHAGVASGVNNAVARVAGLVAIAVAGAAVAAAASDKLDAELASTRLTPAAQVAVDRARALRLTDRAPGTPASERPLVEQALADASQEGFRVAIGIAGGLALLGGLVALAGIRDPRREIPCEDCPGGALVGAPTDARPPEPAPV